MKEKLFSELKGIVKKGTLLCDEPMSGYTSFKTGGPADFLVISSDKEEIKSIILLAKASETPYYIIGNGSNMLVSDAGFRGIVVVLKEANSPIEFSACGEDVYVRAFAGCSLIRLAMEVSKKGLAGMEFASGIPGSLGGAVFMNAGAYGGEIKDVIVSAEVMDENGEVFTLLKDELDLSYRHSAIEEKKLIVLSALFKLTYGDKNEILAKVSELNAKRKEKQPLEYPSAGSTFKRPEGYFAGKLIEDAGLKGFTVGGASISVKHCGFVVNTDHATSSDIASLIDEVIDKVYKDFAVRLEPEVRMLGF